MQFAQSNIFLCLWIVVAFVLFLRWAKTRRNNLLKSFAQEEVLEELMDSFNKRIFLIKKILLVCVFVFSIIALARPQWGFQWQQIKRQGLDIIIAIDTSRSMLTQDVKPTRLDRAKLAVKDLLKKVHGDRVGIIAFSGDAFLVCPLTVDYHGVLLSLEDLDTQTISRGGTNVSVALEEALKGYQKVPSKYKVVVMITDGENLEGNPEPVIGKLQDKGIKVYTIGIGTKEGDLILYENEYGDEEYLKDSNDNFVKSRLDEKLLQKISLMTGGLYVRASGANFGLDLIYNKELSKLEKRDIDSKMEKKFVERFQIPLAFALMLLVVESCLTTRKK